MEALELSEDSRAKVCKNILMWDVSGELCQLAALGQNGNVVMTGLADAIIAHFHAVRPVMLGFDPVISFGAGERLVNDNEHALVLASRHIVRGLGCCVRLLHHTGKESARNGAMDQYAPRGGSALPDGCRMVSVLCSWNTDTPIAKLPPTDLEVGDYDDEQIILWSRPKLSYAPSQPCIWLKRIRWRFEWCMDTGLKRELKTTRVKRELEPVVTKTREEIEASKAAKVAVTADRVHEFLLEEQEQKHTQNSLESKIDIFAVDGFSVGRDLLREAVHLLLDEKRVRQCPLPGRKQHYLLANERPQWAMG